MSIKTIYKFTLPACTGKYLLPMQEGSKILDVQFQNGDIVIWAIVSPEKYKVNRKIEIYFTGRSLPVDPGEYIGTVQSTTGLVYHLFDMTNVV